MYKLYLKYLSITSKSEQRYHEWLFRLTILVIILLYQLDNLYYYLVN